MIVQRGTNAPTAAPVDGTSYSVGSAIGGGVVVYKGSETFFKATELGPGDDYYFVTYSVENDLAYAPGITNVVTLETYLANERVDPFSYKVNDLLQTKNGGNLWTTQWTHVGGWLTNYTGSHLVPTNYPAQHGNSVMWNSTAGDTSVEYKRQFEGATAGKVYTLVSISVETNSGNRYAGFQWYQGASQKMFIGMRGAQTVLGAEQSDFAVSGNGPVTVVPHNNVSPLTNSYTILASYDFSTRAFKMNAYTNKTQAIPVIEPLTWQLELTLNASYLTRLDGIGFRAGGYSGTAHGDVYWDEVRVATNYLQLLGTSLPDPSNLTVNADGFEAADLSWQSDAVPSVMVVRRGTNAPIVGPSVGTSYNVGDSIGGGRVVYKGSLSQYKDVEMGPGDTVYWVYYSYDGGNNYSAGVTNSLTLGTYGAYEIADPASYPLQSGLGTDMDGKAGGDGWTSAWDEVFASWTFSQHTGFSNAPAFAAPAYPESHGWQIKLENPGFGAKGEVDRYFEAVTCGKIYAAAMVAYSFDGANKWAGFDLAGKDGSGTRRAFFGEVGFENHKLGMDEYGSQKSSSYDFNPFAGGNGAPNTQNVYLVIGAYNFDTRVIKTKAFYLPNAVVPTNEPGLSSWDAVDTVTVANAFTEITSLRLKAGTTDGGAYIGDVFFDEVRVGRTWGDLINQYPPRITNFYINGSSVLSGVPQVTDGAMTSGTYAIAGDFQSANGVDVLSPFVANFDLTNAGSALSYVDTNFTGFAYQSGTAASATNVLHPIPASVNVLGVHTVRVSVASSNDAFTLDESRIFASCTRLTFNVYDDDTAGPAYSGFRVNGATTLTDAQLLSGVSLTGIVTDASGIDVTTSFAPDFDVTDPLGNVYSNNHQFAGRPAEGESGALSNWISFTSGQVVLGTWTVTVSAADNDEDRGTVDHENSLDTNVLQFVVTDDDTDCPEAAGFVGTGAFGPGLVTTQELASGGWSLTGLVRDVTSGVNSNGTSVTQPDSSPYFILVDPNNVRKLTNAFDFTFVDGGATSYAPAYKLSVPAVTTPSVGIWTVLVVVADNDEDRGTSDHRICTNTFTIEVGDVPTYDWDAGAGVADRDWSNRTNWTGNVEPTIGNETFVNGGYTAVVSQAGEVARNLYVGDNGSAGGVANGTGTVIQTGGDLLVATNLILGESARDLGRYTIIGGDLVVSNLIVGDVGLGIFTLDGPAADVRVNGALTVSDGGTGTEDIGSRVDHNAGTNLIGVDLQLGRIANTSGEYTMTGGVLTIAGDIRAATDLASTGRMFVSAGSVNVGDDVYVGDAGRGFLTVTGTTYMTVADEFYVSEGISGAEDSGSTFNLGGGTLVNGDNFLIGANAGADGIFGMAGGTFSNGGIFAVGHAAGSTGAVVMTGGSIYLTGTASGDEFFVGNAGRGSMTISGASTVTIVSSSRDLVVGGAGSVENNLLTVNGGVFNVGDDTFVAQSTSSRGTISVGGGTLNASGDIILGDGAGATGALSVASGIVSNQDGNVEVGNSGVGTLTVSGGTLDVNGNVGLGRGLLVVGDASSADNRLDVQGGTVNVDNDINVGNGSSARGTARFAGGTTTVGDDLNVAESSATGTLMLAGGNLALGDDMLVGSAAGARAWLFFSNGTMSVSDDMRLGQASGAAVTMSVTGGVLSVGDALVISGTAGSTSDVVVGGGLVHAGGSIAIGNSAGATFRVTDGTVTGASITVAANSTGAGSLLDVRGGRLEARGAGTLVLGYESTWNMSGGEVFAAGITVGDDDNVAMNLSGGLVVSRAGDFNLGAGGDASSLNLSGGSLVITGMFDVADGANSTGSVYQTGGSVQVNGSSLRIGSEGGTGNRFGFYTITNGTLNVSGAGSDIEIGDGDSATGTGVLHVIGGYSSISVSNDLRISDRSNAQLRVTFVDGNLTPIYVGDDIVVGAGSVISISNVGAVLAGDYTIATSLNASAVSGTFAVTQWLGSATGTVYYTGNRVYITWPVVQFPTMEWDAGGGTANQTQREWQYSVGANWTADSIPGAASNAYINGNHTAVVANAGAVASNLYLGTSGAPTTGGNPTGNLEQVGGDLTLSGDLYIGFTYGSFGSYLMTNGTLNVPNEDVVVGQAGRGIMTIRGTSVVAMAAGSGVNLLVGDGNGSGSEDAGSTLYMEGGTFTVGDSVYLGRLPGADGSIVMSGGLLDVPGYVVVAEGSPSTGRIDISGGEINLQNGNLQVGNNGVGTLAVSGTATVDVNTTGGQGGLWIGNSGTGIMTLYGGTVTADGSLQVGRSSGGLGYVTVTNGILSTGGSLLLGNTGDDTGTGVFHVVGNLTSITIGDAATDDFNMQGNEAELRETFVGGISPMLVNGDIILDGTFTFTNVGAVADGVYLVATSVAGNVSGTFDTVRWLGSATGRVIYVNHFTDQRVLIVFPDTPTYEWDAGGGTGNNAQRDWSYPLNWTYETEPGAVNNGWVNGNYTAVVANASEVASNLYVGSSSAPTTGGNPTGRVEQIGGDLTLYADLKLGDTLGSRGTYVISNGTLNVVSPGEDIVVGQRGVGIMIVTGAANVQISRGTDDRNLLIGDADASLSEDPGSTLYMGGGTFGVGHNLTIARQSGGDGTLLMSGGRMDVPNYIIMGQANPSAARISMNGGWLNVTSHIWVGNAAGATGTITMTAGKLSTVDGNLLMGDQWLGTMSVSGTATVDLNQAGFSGFGDLVVGNNNAGPSNRLDLSGSAVVLMDDDLILGDDIPGARGFVVMSGNPSMTVSDNAFVGDNAGATGMVSLLGGQLTVGTNLVVGNAGYGSLSLEGGTNRVGRNINVAGASGGMGFLTVTNGHLGAASGLNIGFGGAAGGTGVFHVVGAYPSIQVSNLTMSAQNNGELRVSFRGGSLAPIVVSNLITVGGTLSISNDAALTEGEYVVATSLNHTAVSGTFLATNWYGNFTGQVRYVNHKVTIVVDFDRECPESAGFVATGSKGAGLVTTNELLSGSGWTFTGLVYDTISGVNVATDSQGYHQPTNSPYFILYAPDGAARSTQTFSSISFADGGALTPSPVGSAPPAGVAGNIPTGVWTARVVVTDNDGNYADDALTCTNLFTFTVVAPPEPPTAAACALDGSEAINLSWTKNAANNDVMIVARGTNAPGATPTDGVVYIVGDSIENNGDVVIYKGSATSFKAVELSAGATWYFEFFSVNGANQYSVPDDCSATTPSYDTGEIVDPFSYDLDESTGGKAGGQGWTNVWSINSGTWSNESANFPTQSGYPTEHGHRIGTRPANGVSNVLYRGIDEIDCGTVYVSVQLRYEFGEAGGGGQRKMSGVSFCDGSNQVAFFGESPFVGNGFGLATGNTSVASAGESTLVSGSSYTLIGVYDFDNRSLRGLVYTNGGAAIPVREPGATLWSANTTLGGSISRVNGIRLSAGGGSGVNPGNTYFDELRIARTWGDLLRLYPPMVTNFEFGVTNQVTDGQLRSGAWQGKMHIYTQAGLNTTNIQSGVWFIPNYDIMTPNNVEVIADYNFLTSTTFLSGTSVLMSNATHQVIGYNDVVLGVHTARLSAISSNLGSIINRIYAPYCPDTLSFNAVDDDTQFPSIASNVLGRPMGVAVGSSAVSGTDATTNAVFAVTDGQLADTVGGTNLLKNWRFECGTRDWTGAFGTINTTNQAPSEDSSFVLHINEPVGAGFSGVFQDSTTAPLEAHFLSVRARKAVSAAAMSIMDVKIEYLNGSDVIVETFANNIASTLSTNWATYTVASTGAPASAVKVRAVLIQGVPSVAGGLYLDNVVLDNRYSNPFRLAFSAYDAGSGLARGIGHYTNYMNIDVTNLVANNTSNYVAQESQGVGTTATTATSVWSFASINYMEIGNLYSAGSNRVALTVREADDDRPLDTMALTNHQYGYLQVTDDDTADPTHEFIHLYDSSGAYLVVATNNAAGTNRVTNSGSGTNRMWTVPDQVLATLSASQPLRIAVGAQDAGSGLFRGTNGVVCSTGMIMSISIGTAITNDAVNFNTGESTPMSLTTTLRSTNVWIYSSPFTAEQINNLVLAGTSPVYAIIADADMDRPSDQRVFVTQVGFLAVPDDDSDLPQPDNLDSADTTWGSGAANKYLVIATNGAIVADRSTIDSAGTGTVYRVSDGYMANLNTPSNLQFVIGGIDAGSGIAQGASGTTNEIATFRIGSVVNGDSTKTYFTGTTPNGAGGTVTSIWTFSSSALFDQELIDDVFQAKTNAITVTLPDQDADREGDRRVNYDSRVGYFYVYDDDTNRPAVGSALGAGNALAMDFLIGSGSRYQSGSGTGGIFQATDADLVSVGGGNPMQFLFSLYDADSGLLRDAGAPNDAVTLNFDIGRSRFATNLYVTFDSSRSTPTSTGGTTTNTFYHPSPFTYGASVTGNTTIGWSVAYTGEVEYLMSEYENLITVSAFDSDDDRRNSGARVDWDYLLDVEFGKLRVIDDDTLGPTGRLLFVGTDYVRGMTNNLTVTDGDIVDKDMDFAYEWADPSGLFVSNETPYHLNFVSSYGPVHPNFDFVKPSGMTLNIDVVHSATSMFYTTATATNRAQSGSTNVLVVQNNVTNIGRNDIELGSWRLQVSADDLDNDRGFYTVTNTSAQTHTTLLDRATTTNLLLPFLVIDDDSNAPSVSLTVYARGQQASSSGTGTNTIWTVYDADLAEASVAQPLTFSFNAYDDPSGINRSAVHAQRSTNFNVTVTNLSSPGVSQLMVENVTNYNASASSASSAIAGSTSLWTFSSFNLASVDNLYGVTGDVHRVTAFVPDADDDRPNDGAVLSNAQFGFVWVRDDDTAQPTLSNVRVFGTGTALSQAGELVYYSFDDSDGNFDTNAESVVSRLAEFGIAVSSDPVVAQAGNPGNAAAENGGWAPTNKYFRIRLAVQTGFQLTITNVTFDYRSTPTSPDQWFFRYSGDAYASDVRSGALLTDSSYHTTNNVVALGSLTGTNEFRWYGGTSTGTGGGGFWNLDNIRIYGSVAPLSGSDIVSDGDMVSGTFSVTGRVWDAGSGVYSNNHPTSGTRYTIVNSTGATVISSAAFDVGPVSNGAAVAGYTNLYDSTPAAVNPGEVSTGLYVASVLVTDYDQDRTADSLTTTSQYNFTVIDDDELDPEMGKLMLMKYGGSLVAPSGSSTNRIFDINDGRLRNLVSGPGGSSSGELEFVYFVDDASGLVRGNQPAASTQTHMSVSLFTTNNNGNFTLTRSSSDGYLGSNISNTWLFTSPLSYGQVSGLYGQTNPIYLTMFDRDLDRVGDQRARTNLQFAFFTVGDDDGVGPQLRSTTAAFSNVAPVEVWLNGDTNLPGFRGTNLWRRYPDVIFDQAATVDPSTQRYVVTDHQLNQTTNLTLRAWFFDNLSGVNVGNNDATTNSYLSIGTAIVNNVANYRPELSETDPNSSRIVTLSTQYWMFTSFGAGLISDLFNTSGGTNQIVITARDADADRAGDQTTTNLASGYLIVRDDDTNRPSAANLVVEGQYPTNVILDAYLADGLDFYLRLGDGWSGVYTQAPSGSFTNPTFYLLAPDGTVLYTNASFGELTREASMINGGFETAGASASSASAWHFDPGTHGYLARTSTPELLSGSYALRSAFRGTTNAFSSDQWWQWYNVSDLLVGERVVYGGHIKVVGKMEGQGRSLLKLEWWDNTNLTGGAISGDLGTFYTSTDGEWVQTELNSAKPSAAASWLRVFVEVTHESMGGTNNLSDTYFDDVYVGAYDYLRATNSALDLGSYAMGTYTVLVSAADTDADRSSDHLTVSRSTNVLFSGNTFRLEDDDSLAPFVRDLEISSVGAHTTNLTDQQVRNGLWPLEMTYIDNSGIVTNSGDGWLPTYSMINSLGATVAASVAWEHLNAVGSGSTNVVAYRSAVGVDYLGVTTGWYTFVWSAQDLDNDRVGDRMATTNSPFILNISNRVLVIDDDLGNPTPPSNVVVQVVGWTNLTNIAVSWQPGADYSGIYQYRSSTNATAPTAITDGVSVVDSLSLIPLSHSLSNASYEIGAAGTRINPGESNYFYTGYGTSGSTGSWTAAVAAQGAQSMQQVVNSGLQNNGDPRFSLVGQTITISNDATEPLYVYYSGSFRGDLSAGGIGFLKMEFYDAGLSLIQVVDNEINNDHNGQPLNSVNTGGNWSNVFITATNGPASTRYIRFLTGINQGGTTLGFTGYWDSLSASVSLQRVVGSTVTNVAEGSNTVWLFSVDDDNDRVSDRLKSPNTNFVTLIDRTAPPQVALTNGEPNFNGDEFSEAVLYWVPAPNAGNRMSDNAELSPWDSYVIYYTDDGTPPSATNYAGLLRDSDYLDLAPRTSESVIISNLEFGTDYRFVIAGLDQAGNRGQVSGVVTVEVEGFVLTQGLHKVTALTNGAHLAWTAGLNPFSKDFDLIYVDRSDPGFTESLTDEWVKVSTVNNSFYVDTGSATRANPLNLGSAMRFYRAARKDRWLPSQATRLGSREVYVAKNLQLKEGENWVSLFFIPDSNTVSEVLGTHSLPAGNNLLNSTAVEWYGATQDGGATNTIWLDSAAGWTFAGGGNANHYRMPLNEGFNIVIPTGSGDVNLLVIGEIPTNTVATVDEGTMNTIRGSGIYNVVSYNFPYRIELTNSGIREMGFSGAPSGQAVNPNNSDEIRILQRGGGSLAAPKVRILMNANGQFVYWSGGPFLQSAEFYHFDVDDTIIIYTRQSIQNMIWSNEPPYALPTKNFTP